VRKNELLGGFVHAWRQLLPDNLFANLEGVLVEVATPALQLAVEDAHWCIGTPFDIEHIGEKVNGLIRFGLID
jgi:hypothetical protein